MNVLFSVPLAPAAPVEGKVCPRPPGSILPEIPTYTIVDSAIDSLRFTVLLSRISYQAPRSWAEKAYPKLVHYNKLPKGGHFAAWEQPAFLAGELRAGFKPLR